MQRAAHIAAQCVVNHLMLLHARLAAEGFRDHLRGIMIPIAGKTRIVISESGAFRSVFRSPRAHGIGRPPGGWAHLFPIREEVSRKHLRAQPELTRGRAF